MLVPNEASSQCLLRVRDGINPALYNDVSDSTFSIVGNTLKIITPNGGEYFLSGRKYFITWVTTGTIPKINLFLSIDSGATFTKIFYPFTSLNNDGSFEWKIPDTIKSEKCLIQIISADSATADTSDNVFSIYNSTLTLMQPNGNEQWASGGKQLISWITTGQIPRVGISFSRDNGQVWKTLDSNILNDGSWLWTIKEPTSDSCLIKVVSKENSSIYDLSDGVFQIINSEINILQPNGGEHWEIGSKQNIFWNTTNFIEKVNIKISLNNGSDWNTIATNISNDGSFNWIISYDSLSSSDSCIIKVSNANNDDIYDLSDSVFTLFQGEIVITKPNGGEIFNAGSHHLINWIASQTIRNVSLAYRCEDSLQWNTINSSTPNDGSFDWSIKSSVPSGLFRIRINSVDDTSIADISDSAFTIMGKSIQLTSPNGNEIWNVGMIKNITWSSTDNINYVKLEYSRDSGASWIVIQQSKDNTRSYQWKIPAMSSSNLCFIKVSETENSLISDISDSVFTIKNYGIQVEQPNGGENYTIGSTQTISWTAPVGVKQVNVFLSYNNGENWEPIKTSLPNNGSFSWKIKIKIKDSDSCLLKIADAKDSLNFDVSDSLFSIGYEPLPFDASSFRTLEQTDGLNAKPVMMKFTERNVIKSPPNYSTVIEYFFLKNKDKPTFLGIKQSDIDSIQKYCWVIFKTANEFRRFLSHIHNGVPSPLDSIQSNGSKKKKLSKAYSPGNKVNNFAWAEGVLFNFNLMASNDSILPPGLGNLVLNDTLAVFFNRSFHNTSLNYIAKTFDSLMTYPKLFDTTTEITAEIASMTTKILKRVNGYFYAPIDTSNIFVSLKEVQVDKNKYAVHLLGVKSVSDTGFLRLDTISSRENQTVRFYQSGQENNTSLLTYVYPNPFNPTTAISFQLSAISEVTLKIYNVLGQEVAVLIDNERMENGEHEVQFDASGLPSGVYFYRLNVNNGEFMQTKKLLLMK